MKKIKQVLSIFLAGVMLTATLAACADKATFFTTLKSASEIEICEFSYEINMESTQDGQNHINAGETDISSDFAPETLMSGNTYLKFSGESDSKAKMVHMDIEYKSTADGTYTKLTDMIMVENGLYVNAKAIYDGLIDQMGEGSSMFAPFYTQLLMDKEYIKIPYESQVTDSTRQTALSLNEDLYSVIENGITSIDPTVLSKDQKGYALKMDTVATMKAVTSILTTTKERLSTWYDDIIIIADGMKIPDFSGMMQEDPSVLAEQPPLSVEQLKQNKDAVIQQLTDQIDLILTECQTVIDTGSSSYGTVDIDSSVLLQGKAGERVFTTNFGTQLSLNGSFDASISFLSTITEKKSISEIAVPDSTIDFEQALSNYTELITSFDNYTGDSEDYTEWDDSADDQGYEEIYDDTIV